MKKETSARALICRVLMLLYILSVAYLCFKNFRRIPDVPQTLFGIPMDKIVHFFMFLPFPVLGYFSFDHKKWSKTKTVGRIIEVCAYGVIFAGITELVQSMLPYRTQDIKDFQADILAIGVSSIMVLVIELMTRRRSRR